MSVKENRPDACAEPLPVKRTVKKYKVFPASDLQVAGRFLCSETQPVLFHRCQYAEVALNSPGVVIANVAHNHLDKLLLAGKTPAIIAFPFQDAPETFHGAIVNTVGNTGHALYHSCLYEFLVERSACILVSSVTVKQRMCVRVGLNSPVKGLEYKRIVIVFTQRIGYDAPITEIQNRTQIEPMCLNTLIPFEFRHISKPFLIGLISVKLAVQQVFGKILRIPGPPGTAVVITFHSRSYISGPADPQYSLVIDIDAIIMAQIVIQSPVAFIWAFRMYSFNLVR